MRIPRLSHLQKFAVETVAVNTVAVTTVAVNTVAHEMKGT
jgi:hypothetical protein